MRLVHSFTYFILILFLSFSITAQNNDTASVSIDSIPFKVFKTRNSNLSYNDIVNPNISFKESNSFKEKTHPDDIYWVRLDFENELGFLSNNRTWFLNFNTIDYGELFYEKNNTIEKKSIGQYDFPTWSEKIKSKKYFSEVSFTTNSLLKNRYLYLKVKRVTFLENLNNWNFGSAKNAISNDYSASETKSLLPVYIYIGIIIIMSIIMFVFFFYFKKMEFLCYSLYALALLLFMTKDEWQLFDFFLPNNIFLKVWLLNTLQIFIPLGYLFFMIFYLNLKKDYPLAFKVIKTFIYIYLSLLFIDILFYFFKYNIGHIYILKLFPIIGILIAVFSIPYLLVNNKNRITSLFILGFFFFISGTGIHFYTNVDSDPLLYNNKIYFIIGTSIEIVIFAFGLVYKIFTEHIDKLNFQQQATLNKNKALRAQINPHFIFNSLSSIQHLVTNNNRVSALIYLSKFSRLTRNILESSIETNAVLSEEIKMLKDYLELESLRFDNAFSYSITIDDKLNIDTVEIPFMILQPFVENAIIHGLLPKVKGNKILNIDFKQEEDAVVCKIEDNGIGRKTADQKEHIHKKEKKSRGMEVTKQRLNTLRNNLGSNLGTLDIIDKTNAKGESLGTIVIVKIPT
ncbi:possible sensor protein [Flavobacteriales bacterium ALC-1]|nr:possible sensor protein [Flavobacteriales bacterium ALC-1]